MIDFTALTRSHIADRHLDLGCGTIPRNPYGRSALFGVDIRQLESAATAQFEFVAANLSFEPIPFPASQFASVSAFDFIEHIPRVLNGAERNTTVFPFIRLMNEVWRALAPGGLFYALTPCYPGREAFSDPTHVNVITERTHAYFCGAEPLGRMYGFDGRFTTIRSGWAVSQDNQHSEPLRFWQKVRLIQHTLKGQLSHYLWELEAVKS